MPPKKNVLAEKHLKHKGGRLFELQKQRIKRKDAWKLYEHILHKVRTNETQEKREARIEALRFREFSRNSST
jgi:hypothetical protein